MEDLEQNNPLSGDHTLILNLFPERHDALYVVGALDEAMELRGMRYHPIDIETSVIRTHKSIMEWYDLLTYNYVLLKRYDSVKIMA